MSNHGTTSRYVQGCRCEDCKSANRSYSRSYRETRRRVLSGGKVGKRTRRSDVQVLDAAVEKVGQDFPSLGALVRAGWTGAA